MTKTFESLRYEIKHVRDPIRSKSDEWQDTADQWLIIFTHDGGFFTVDYFTGIGHRDKKFNRPKKPSIKDVIHSLYMDATAENENFSDWCANFGYSDDSIKAVQLYKACIENGVKLRKLGLSRDYLNAEFENY